MRRSVVPAFVLAGAAVTMLVIWFSGANAEQPIQRVQVGVLECRGGTSIGFIVGSVTNLGCVLRVNGMPEDRYVATIRKVGVDLGITEETALAWGVSPATTRARRAARRSASVLAATSWSAGRTIRSRCSHSACKVRSV